MNLNGNIKNQKRNHIAIIHFSGPPAISGVDLLIKDQARLFRLYNYRPELVTGNAKQFRKDIPIHNISLIDTQNPEVLKVRHELEGGVLSPLFYKIEEQLYIRLKKYILRKNISVCIIHNIFTRHYNLPLTSALVRLSNDLPGVKFVIWVHDVTFYNQPDLKLDKKLADTFPWSLLVTPHQNMIYVCVSDFLQKDLLNAFSKKEVKNIMTIPNVKDVQKFLRLTPIMRDFYGYIKGEESDLIAVVPVRAVPRKRLEFAIDVAREMINQKVNFKLILTANIDYKREENIRYFEMLKRKVVENGLERNVFFLEEYFKAYKKEKNKQRVPIMEAYLISDLLLLPSSIEGFGLPIIEAGLLRCPIFASDIPPFREIGTTNINYFSLTDSPKKVAGFILSKISKMPQSYFYRKVIHNYSMRIVYRDRIIPIVEKLINASLD